MSCCRLSFSKDGTLARLLEWITEFSPRQNYGIWLYMNGAILLWSLLLLAELCRTHDISHTRDRIEGTEAYLVYSFGAMQVWVLGAGLHLLDHVYVHQIVARWNREEGQGQEDQYCRPEERRLLNSCNGDITSDTESQNDSLSQEESASQNENKKESKRLDLCAVLFEFILSVNFLDYSRRAFSSWNTPDDQVGTELFDIFINIGAFSYQVVRIWQIREEDIARELAEVAQAVTKAEGDTDDESNTTSVFEEIP
ncbi:MAG: hypothetical protein SGBAC_004210 [Bacillariaceae sp.]